jgi:hypothetical protein
MIPLLQGVHMHVGMTLAEASVCFDGAGFLIRPANSVVRHEGTTPAYSP